MHKIYIYIPILQFLSFYDKMHLSAISGLLQLPSSDVFIEFYEVPSPVKVLKAIWPGYYAANYRK